MYGSISEALANNGAIAAALALKPEVLSGLVSKAWTQPTSTTTGLNYYNLEAPAKMLYPVITPIRNRVPRSGDGAGTAVNWKAITAVNINALEGGVPDGTRGGVIATTIIDKLAAYKTLGFEDYATFQAQWSAKRFDDARARAVQGLLRSLMIYEEKIDLGGNANLALGTPTTPTTALVAGGAMTAQVTQVQVVALTLQGFLASTVAGGIPVVVSVSPADGSSAFTFGGGSSQISASAPQTTAGGNLSVSMTTPVVKGAVGYAWFWGLSGAVKLGAITTINSYTATADATGTQLATATNLNQDNSKNANVWDGLLSQTWGTTGTLTQVAAVGSTCTIYNSVASGVVTGGLVGQMATGTVNVGTVLTADGKGGITEIDAMLKAFWDVYRLSPDTMYVSSQEALNITAKILTGNSNPAFRFNLAQTQSGLVGGMVVRSYLNKFAPTSSMNPADLGSGGDVLIQIHPNIAPGTILFYSNSVPYQMSGVTQVVEKECRNDYFQLEWPLRSLKYEYGCYVDGTLKVYFPGAFGILTNIANG